MARIRACHKPLSVIYQTSTIVTQGPPRSWGQCWHWKGRCGEAGPSCNFMAGDSRIPRRAGFSWPKGNPPFQCSACSRDRFLPSWLSLRLRVWQHIPTYTKAPTKTRQNRPKQIRNSQTPLLVFHLLVSFALPHLPHARIQGSASEMKCRGQSVRVSDIQCFGTS